MEMENRMSKGEAVEIALRGGHIVYGKFIGVCEEFYVIRTPEGDLTYVPSDQGNLAYIRVVMPDTDLSRAMGSLEGRPCRVPVCGTQEPEVSPKSRVAAIEAVKRKYGSV